MTFNPDPPLGRYSSGTCGSLSLNLAHPPAPSRDTPAAPVPATLKKALRVSVLFDFLLKPIRPPRRSPSALYQVNGRCLLNLGEQAFSEVPDGSFLVAYAIWPCMGSPPKGADLEGDPGADTRP